MQGLVKCFAVGWGGRRGSDGVLWRPRIPFHGTPPATIFRREIQASATKPEGVWGVTPSYKKWSDPPRPPPFPGRFSCGFMMGNLVAEEVCRVRGVGVVVTISTASIIMVTIQRLGLPADIFLTGNLRWHSSI